MSSIVSSITGTNSSVTETKTRANLNGEPIPTFKFRTEDITPRVQSTIIETTNIEGNTTLIWGNTEHGIWGNSNWGSSYTSSTIEITTVVLEGNYVEDFGTLTFCDISNTTADWGGLN